jgi:acetyl-CoA carboxylase biotin carboxyl carrier protein
VRFNFREDFQMAHNEVPAEMAGTVKEVLVRAGETVAIGQELVIIESMKMEVPVESPYEGRVLQLMVDAGAVVEQGAVLALIES